MLIMKTELSKEKVEQRHFSQLVANFPLRRLCFSHPGRKNILQFNVIPPDMLASSLLLIAALSCILHVSWAFRAPINRGKVGVQGGMTLSVLPKPTPEEVEKYWQGDWVCADCGYIYDREIDGGGLWFEQQQRGFICPQCSAPRKRYAKKVGDTWGVTRGTFCPSLCPFFDICRRWRPAHLRLHLHRPCIHHLVLSGLRP